jgi:hypothetical protein
MVCDIGASNKCRKEATTSTKHTHKKGGEEIEEQKEKHTNCGARMCASIATKSRLSVKCLTFGFFFVGKCMRYLCLTNQYCGYSKKKKEGERRGEDTSQSWYHCKAKWKHA